MRGKTNSALRPSQASQLYIYIFPAAVAFCSLLILFIDALEWTLRAVVLHVTYYTHFIVIAYISDRNRT